MKKKIRFSLNQHEAVLMADNLEMMRVFWPEKAKYDDDDGGYAYEADCVIFLMIFTVWERYYTKLMGCTAQATVNVDLPIAYARAYKLGLDWMKHEFKSEHHQMLALQTYQQIDQMIR